MNCCNSTDTAMTRHSMDRESVVYIMLPCCNVQLAHFAGLRGHALIYSTSKMSHAEPQTTRDWQ